MSNQEHDLLIHMGAGRRHRVVAFLFCHDDEVLRRVAVAVWRGGLRGSVVRVCWVREWQVLMGTVCGEKKSKEINQPSSANTTKCAGDRDVVQSFLQLHVDDRVG